MSTPARVIDAYEDVIDMVEDDAYGTHSAVSVSADYAARCGRPLVVGLAQDCLAAAASHVTTA